MADDERKNADGISGKSSGQPDGLPNGAPNAAQGNASQNDALSDAQVNAVFADLEKQFSSDFEERLSALDDNLVDPGLGSDAGLDAGSGSGPGSRSDAERSAAQSAAQDALSAGEPSLDPHFDDELAGILGQKATVALVLAPFADAHIFAALARIAEVEMSVFFIPTGCVGLLHDLDGQGPEEAARALSEMMTDVPFLLSVNRADKVTLARWEDGKQVEELIPPLVFSGMSDVVEDIMIGFTTSADLPLEGYDVVESSSYDEIDDATHYLAGLMRASRNPFAPDNSDGSDASDASDGEAV